MRKICIVTGSRAEYGLLNPLMKLIQGDPQMCLQIIATNMHLSPEFGLTYKEIEKDGYSIDKKVEMLLSSDTANGITKSIGLATIGFADAFEDLKPDLLIVLGDRYEILSAVTAALFYKIPVAHLHGGEITEGAYDDSIRHAITKMSHLHFASTAEYRKRVIQLGEQPDTVFNVGAIGIDNIKKFKLLSKNKIQKKLGFTFKKKNLLVTYHPATLDDSSSESQFRELLKAMDELKDTLIIFTKPNSDTDGRVIIRMIDEFVAKNSDKAISFISMGQLNYLSVMQNVDAVVGNSSSGIIEAPSFNIGTINIGDRQKGRIAADTVIDCLPSYASISNALNYLYSKEFKLISSNVSNPYGEGETAYKIFTHILEFKPVNTKKLFFNCK